MNNRPELNEVPIPDIERSKCYITIDPGAWDKLIKGAYDAGWTLLEIVDERPVRAFRKAQ